MRLVCYQGVAGPTVGVVVDGSIVDLNACAERAGGGPYAMSPQFRDVADVFRAAAMLQRLGARQSDGMRGAQQLVERLLETPGVAVPPDVARLTPVLTPEKVIGVGLNFHSYVEQIGVSTPLHPVLFHKTASALLACGQPVVIPPSTNKAVVEGELAVVIGRRARSVSEADALDYVAGFTCANDISARDLEFQTSQLTPGKMIETFCPLGPELVTPDECGAIEALYLTTTINGVEVQHSQMNGHIFNVSALISRVSQLVGLEIGDVILTGTPNDLGHGDNPTFLRDGDVVAIEIPGVGRLENSVQDAS